MNFRAFVVGKKMGESGILCGVVMGGGLFGFIFFLEMYKFN